MRAEKYLFWHNIRFVHTGGAKYLSAVSVLVGRGGGDTLSTLRWHYRVYNRALLSGISDWQTAAGTSGSAAGCDDAIAFGLNGSRYHAIREPISI